MKKIKKLKFSDVNLQLEFSANSLELVDGIRHGRKEKDLHDDKNENISHEIFLVQNH
jgi:hypothetical protein